MRRNRSSNYPVWLPSLSAPDVPKVGVSFVVTAFAGGRQRELRAAFEFVQGSARRSTLGQVVRREAREQGVRLR